MGVVFLCYNIFMEEIIENLLNRGVEINKNVIFADKGDMYYRPVTEGCHLYGDIVVSDNFYTAELKINSMITEPERECICKKIFIWKKEVDKKNFSVKRVILQFPFCFSSNKNDVNGEKIKIKLIDDDGGGFMKNKNIKIEYRDGSSIDDAIKHINDIDMFLTCKYRKKIRPKYIIFINEKNEEILYLWNCKYFLSRWTECLNTLDELEELVEYIESDERCKHIFNLYSDFIFSCEMGSENLKLLSLFACVDGLYKNIKNENSNQKSFEEKIYTVMEYINSNFLEEYKELLNIKLKRINSNEEERNLFYRKYEIKKYKNWIEKKAKDLKANLNKIRNCVMHGGEVDKDKYYDIFFSGILGFENNVNKRFLNSVETNFSSIPYLIWCAMIKNIKEAKC